MKRILLLGALMLTAAGVLYLQTTDPRPELASWMPGGALLCVEASDFNRLMQDWDSSAAKSEWLASDNYAAFKRSNLFSKLGGVYGEYGAVGYQPGLKGLLELAGKESALALYDIRDVQFLYITKLDSSRLAQAQLWAMRDKFESRQASGLSFYLKADPISRRTVAFAFTKGYFLLATRDDLVGRALALMAGEKRSNLGAESWYREAVTAKKTPGELRMVLNLEPITDAVHFRSYWLHRNTSTIRQFSTGIADMSRSSNTITETRLFLRKPDAAANVKAPGPEMVAQLLPLAPDTAGYYRVLTAPTPADTARLVMEKLIGPVTSLRMKQTYAPGQVDLDASAGAESDLETRIDEEPLAPQAGVSETVPPLQTVFEQQAPTGLLQVQKSVAVDSTFIRTPCALVITTQGAWQDAAIRAALRETAGRLWSTGDAGVQWVQDSAGNLPVWRLDGLGQFYTATDGGKLYVANDRALLQELLDRARRPVQAGPYTYAAVFRAAEEQPHYERLMRALDRLGSAPAPQPDGGRYPAVFSDNLGSLYRLLVKYPEVSIREQDTGSRVEQTIRYGPR